MKDVNEVNGTVQAWPGEAEASCGARLVVTRFPTTSGPAPRPRRACC